MESAVIRELHIGDVVCCGELSPRAERVVAVMDGKQPYVITDFSSRPRLSAYSVPVTDKLLESLGFRKAADNVRDITVNGVDVELTLDNGAWLPTLDDGRRAIGRPVEGLHQLQGLVRMLTGRELGISMSDIDGLLRDESRKSSRKP